MLKPDRFGPLLCLIVLAGWALRLFRLDYHTAWVDEAFIVFFAEQAWPALIEGLRLHEPHPPLYFALMHVWLQPPITDVWLRAPSVLFGTALVAAVGALGRRLLGPGPGLVAALLAAVSAYGIWYAQEARMYSALVCFAALSLLALLRAVSVPRSPLRWALYLGLSLAGLLTHYFFAFALLGTIAVAVVARHRATTEQWRPLTAVHFLLAAVWAGWVVGALPSLSGRNPSSDPLSFSEVLWQTWRWLMLGRALVVEPRVWDLLAVASGLLAIVGLALALRAVRPHGRTLLGLTAGVVFPLLAIFLVSQRTGSIYTDRYVIFLLPLLVLLAAAPLAAGDRWVQAFGGISVAAVLLGNLLSLGWYWFHPLYGKGEDFRQVAAAIQAASQPGDVLIENDNNETLRYYLYRVGSSALPWVMVPVGGNGAVRADADRETATVARAHTRVWLTERSTRFWWDPASLVEKWMQGHCPKLSEANLGGARVLLFQAGAACVD